MLGLCFQGLGIILRDHSSASSGIGCALPARLIAPGLAPGELLGSYERIDAVSGRVFNIGGGPANTLSLLELLALFKKMSGKELPHTFGDWRPGDQRVYISDIRRAQRELGWTPKMAPEPGIARMRDWMGANRETILRVYRQ